MILSALLFARFGASSSSRAFLRHHLVCDSDDLDEAHLENLLGLICEATLLVWCARSTTAKMFIHEYMLKCHLAFFQREKRAFFKFTITVIAVFFVEGKAILALARTDECGARCTVNFHISLDTHVCAKITVVADSYFSADGCERDTRKLHVIN